jgi:hypothetical protein
MLCRIADIGPSEIYTTTGMLIRRSVDLAAIAHSAASSLRILKGACLPGMIAFCRDAGLAAGSQREMIRLRMTSILRSGSQTRGTGDGLLA